MDPRHRDKNQFRRGVDTTTADFLRAQTSARAVPLPVSPWATSRSAGPREVAQLTPANPVAGFHQPSMRHGGGGSQRVNADEFPSISFGGGKGGDGGPGVRKGGDGGDGMGVVVNMPSTALTQEAADFFRAVFGADGRGGAGIGGKGGAGPVGGKGGRGMGQVFNVD
ncbi:hypothetical protein MSAN_01832500 [Mycena sanguinolenta]|uniref:Uncharacterized protein n=1 Tax=Mycena sanguinolenta TaxID=230812 RepID=A0A8H6XSR6_9AGAR|nr:hypothetical protein MSAN_01832500 [Mycena sanguinolenta]